MNIRLSLKVVFLPSMVIYGVAMAYVFFVFSFDLYKDGNDDSVRKLMIETAQSTELNAQSVVSALGYTITNNWRDIPDKYRERVQEPPSRPYELREFANFSNEDVVPESVDYVLMIKDANDRPVYVSKSISRLALDAVSADAGIGPYSWSILVGMITAVAFSLLLWLVLNILVKPLELLRSWAADLTVENLNSPAPSFKYSEFSSLAEIVRSSLASVRASVENEQEFLSYASHELRSPLTAMRSNVSLLKKKQSHMQSDQYPIIERIDRATLTMSQLVQTLLWLSRDYQPENDDEMTELDVLTREVMDELNYLRSGKSIEVELDTEPHTMQASKMACRIALSNLIRNAFQHTEEGLIKICQSGETITVRNPIGAASTGTSSEIGFGLGAKLTTKLVKQYGWRFSTENDSKEFIAKLIF